MTTKIVYDKNTGGEVIAHESPLEPGVFLMPAGSVDEAPPVFDPETQMLRYENGWIVDDIPEPEPAPEPEPHEPTYIELRMSAYGSVRDQIEYITENGLAAWQAKVSDIKAQYPKPE